jgi:FixJ family two-component response regulator
VRVAIEADRGNREKQRLIANLRPRFESLSSREREVMALVTTGKMNKLIANELGLSEATVKSHRHNVMLKMVAKSVANLVRMAVDLTPRK